jgi:hypothetical protein
LHQLWRQSGSRLGDQGSELPRSVIAGLKPKDFITQRGSSGVSLGHHARQKFRHELDWRTTT